MAKEWRRIEFHVTTKDYEDLPDDMDADDVVWEIEQAMAKAGAAWYRERGHLLLAYEPEFAWGREDG
jgi:hypothetical protein